MEFKFNNSIRNIGLKLALLMSACYERSRLKLGVTHYLNYFKIQYSPMESYPLFVSSVVAPKYSTGRHSRKLESHRNLKNKTSDVM